MIDKSFLVITCPQDTSVIVDTWPAPTGDGVGLMNEHGFNTGQCAAFRQWQEKAALGDVFDVSQPGPDRMFVICVRTFSVLSKDGAGLLKIFPQQFREGNVTDI